MAKEYKPGFVYIKSDLLKQEIAFSKNTGWVYCEDGVRYNPDELTIFKKVGGELDIAMHMVKKIIGGEVIKIERKVGGYCTPQSNESGYSDSTVDNQDTSKKISGVNGNGTANRDGELEIY